MALSGALARAGTPPEELHVSAQVTFDKVDDVEKLQPRRLYERTGRLDEYTKWVERFKRERVEFLARYEGLLPEVAHAVE
jgi:hypothetical protein